MGSTHGWRGDGEHPWAPPGSSPELWGRVLVDGGMGGGDGGGVTQLLGAVAPSPPSRRFLGAAGSPPPPPRGVRLRVSWGRKWRAPAPPPPHPLSFPPQGVTGAPVTPRGPHGGVSWVPLPQRLGAPLGAPPAPHGWRPRRGGGYRPRRPRPLIGLSPARRVPSGARGLPIGPPQGEGRGYRGRRCPGHMAPTVPTPP